MSHKVRLCCLATALIHGSAVACDISYFKPFHFAGEEVRGVELIQSGDPLLGGVQKREVLAEGRINEFLVALNRSKHRGVYKVHTPYLLRFKLGSGDTWELKATAEMVSDRNKDDYYAFEGGAEFLRRFFPNFFEQPPFDAPPNSGMHPAANSVAFMRETRRSRSCVCGG